MGGILYIVAVVLVALWLLGFFVAHVGSIIHLLLVLAVVAVIWNLLMGNRRTV